MSGPGEPRGEVVELPDDIAFIAVQWVDVHGATKARLVPRDAWERLCSDGGGVGFAAFTNDGWARAPEHPTLTAVPDPTTTTVLPHQPDLAVAFSTVFDGDGVASCDARAILARMQHEAGRRGLLPIVGMELEFFLLRELEHGGLAPFDVLDDVDRPGHDLKALLRGAPLLKEIAGAIDALDWGVSSLGHEDGNGQFDIAFGPAPALQTADRFTLLRTLISDVADRHGVLATFMPKPLVSCTGSGAHVHLSAHTPDGENVFLDRGDTRGLGLSRTAYSFIAGMLDHGRALSALTMPTVNSYKRLHSSSGPSGATWSPDAIVYGADNRTAMVRVPAPGRFENRAVDASANPYLALAGLIAAGLDGVDRDLDPGAPITGAASPIGAPMLPRTLAEALDALEGDALLRDELGEEAVCELIAVKRMEWGSYMDSVSAWERRTYLRRA